MRYLMYFIFGLVGGILGVAAANVGLIVACPACGVDTTPTWLLIWTLGLTGVATGLLAARRMYRTSKGR